jgi:hypothetical protein
MTDTTVQRKLNQLRKIANELADEAQLRSPEGSLFYESEGNFHLMDGDCDSGAMERQKHILFSSDGYCRMGCGSW